MFDNRSNEWLSRLPRNGPWLVTLLLSALVAVELARIAIALLGGSPAASLQAPPQPAAHSPAHAAVDTQSIAAAHLFGIAAAESGAQDPANAPPTTANLVLYGTIATQDPRHGIAIISDSGPSKVYSVGDRIGGAALHLVYLDRVILDRDGNLETLKLPKIVLTGRPQIEPAAMAGNQRTMATLNNIRQLVQHDPGLLSSVIRAVASYDNRAGRLRGFRIYPGFNRRAFNVLGLRPGDLVTAINGQALDDPQHSQEVFNTIQSSDQATVTINRGGQTMDLSLNVAQVANEADRDLLRQRAATAPLNPPDSRTTNPNATD